MFRILLLGGLALACTAATSFAETVPEDKVSAASNAFGFQLLRVLDNISNRNVIISPLGSSLVPMLAYNGTADPNTILMLTDAVYFRGKWALPSIRVKRLTAFFLGSGRSVATPMMARTDEYPYFETSTFQAIRLDYGNGRFAMCVFLPRMRDGISNAAALLALIKSLDQSHWSKWTSMMSEQLGRIIMPRFELRYGEDFRSVLETLGLRVIFSLAADFSKIPISSVPLTVSSLVHETYVKVDEEGTTAAAASAMNMVAGAFPHHELPPFELAVDHPFFCAIAETKTKYSPLCQRN